MRAQAVHRAHSVLGVRDRDVDVQGERGLPARELAQRRVQELIALATGDPRLLPDGRWVHACGGRTQPSVRELAAELAAQSPSSAIAWDTPSCTPVRSSIAEPCVSASTWSARCGASVERMLSIRGASAKLLAYSSITSSSIPTVQGRQASSDGQRLQAARGRTSRGLIIQAACCVGSVAAASVALALAPRRRSPDTGRGRAGRRRERVSRRATERPTAAISHVPRCPR